MRKLILSILLAGVAATPAIAQDGRWHRDEDGPTQSTDIRSAARQERQEQRQQAEPQRQVQVDRSQRFEMRQQQSSEQSRGNWDRSRFGGQANTAPQQAIEQQQVRQQWQSRDGSRWTRDRSNWTGSRDAQSGSWSRGDLRQGDRPTPNVMRDRNPTIATEQQQQGRTGTWSGRTWTRDSNTRWSGTWNRDWRNDRRYDWRRYRDSHRSIFRIGVYFDPFGYNYYRPLSIGYRLQPYYYGQRYWIDPGMYNLPYPPPGTMWVRYWNDALLVDTYSGEVVDVIRDFFW
jgi:hypothetical protein